MSHPAVSRTQQTLDLFAQAEGVRAVAESAGDAQTRALAIQGAVTIEAVARRREKQSSGGVLCLPATSTVAEVAKHRRRRSVKYGEDVYLPSWQDATVGLPNLLLRSALFSAATPGELLVDHPLAAQGNVELEMTGPQLCDYDRRLFAVCLDHYRHERPLASHSSQWVRTTFWQLSQAMQVAYNGNVHKAIRNSLKRLHAATLRVRVGRHDLPMPRLIEVAFDDGFTGMNTPDDQLKGSDLAVFRVQESMAMLFGPNDWTAVSENTLHDHEGLASWLCGFYATHAGPYELEVAKLYAYSGSKGPMAEFRKRLKKALNKLESADTAVEHRVARYAMTKDRITVHLVRWGLINE